ncbi:MAG: glycosyltransferase family 4 protein [Planctomycetota bacterium]
MRVAIDCSHHLIPGGIRTHIGNLLEAITAEEPANDYVLFYRGRHRPRELPAVAAGAAVETLFQRVPRRLMSYLENSVGWPPVERWRGGLDVFHGTHFTLPVTRNARSILTVHDATYLRHPELYGHRKLNDHCYRYLLPRSLERADLVLAISLSTRNDLVELCGVDEERIWVVPNGLDPRVRPLPREERGPVLERLGIRRPFVLYPAGTIDRRKNIDNALRAFARAFPRKAARPLLFLTGVGELPRRYAELVLRLGLEQDVMMRKVGYPDELIALMSGALWGMYLSLYEGFGLPPLEGMACGLPMLVSDASSIPEVTGDAALLADPRDVDALAAAMERLHAGDDLRRDLRRRGRERAAEPAFGWRRAARQTLAAYRLDRAAYEAEPQPLAEAIHQF